jgi:hypothetical protein
MRNNSEMMFLNNLMAEKRNQAQLRAQMLTKLTGLKYWLYLLGL